MTDAVIGVLALQGTVREHRRVLAALGRETREVRRPRDLAGLGGLVIPGGESSTMDKLAAVQGLHEPIRAAIAAGMPVLGTCAGLIMLADRIIGGLPGQRTFGGLDIMVRRNAFGSQIDSFETELEMPSLGAEPVPAMFIRAPIIESVGAGAEALAHVGERVVAVRQGNLLGLAFHPELTGDRRCHARFVELVDAHAAAAAVPAA